MNMDKPSYGGYRGGYRAALAVLVLSFSLAQEHPLPQPSPQFSAAEVVRIQLEALGNNDQPYQDAGIATAFNFASPANRQATGPLERFILLVKNPVYRDMIDHVSADYGRLEVVGDEARQVIILSTPDGRRALYVFVLSKQADGEFAGSWMTDSVLRLELDDPNLASAP